MFVHTYYVMVDVQYIDAIKYIVLFVILLSNNNYNVTRIHTHTDTHTYTLARTYKYLPEICLLVFSILSLYVEKY